MLHLLLCVNSIYRLLTYVALILTCKELTPLRLDNVKIHKYTKFEQNITCGTRVMNEHFH